MVTISIQEQDAYGYLNLEKGVHRREVIPFDAAHRPAYILSLVKFCQNWRIMKRLSIHLTDIIRSYKSSSLRAKRSKKHAQCGLSTTV
jgi:protein subunit release factor B